MARDMAKTKRCPKCGTRKVISRYFYKNPTAPSGFDCICRECRKKRVRECLKMRQDPKRVTYLAEYRRTPHGRAVTMFNQKRAYCREYGVEFDLTVDWIRKKIDSGRCELTGIRFTSLAHFQADKADPFMFSLDRKNHTGGYTKKNTRAVIFAANVAKRDWSDKILLTWAKELVRTSEGRAA